MIVLPDAVEVLINVQEPYVHQVAPLLFFQPIWFSCSVVKLVAFYGLLLLGLVNSLRTLRDVFTHQGYPMPWKFKILMPIAYFLVASRLVFEREHSCPLVIGREYPEIYPIGPDTPDQYRSAMIDVTNDQSYRGHSTAWRVQHGKIHGCVKAEFVVDESLAPYLRYGLFSNPRSSYPAYIRFSNALDPLAPDSDAQVRLGCKWCN